VIASVKERMLVEGYVRKSPVLRRTEASRTTEVEIQRLRSEVSRESTALVRGETRFSLSNKSK